MPIPGEDGLVENMGDQVISKTRNTTLPVVSPSCISQLRSLWLKYHHPVLSNLVASVCNQDEVLLGQA